MFTETALHRFVKNICALCFGGNLPRPKIKIVKKSKLGKAYYAFTADGKKNILVLCPAQFGKINWKIIVLHEMVHHAQYHKYIYPIRGKALAIKKNLKNTRHSNKFWLVFDMCRHRLGI
jgi:hypothetical protein